MVLLSQGRPGFAVLPRRKDLNRVELSTIVLRTTLRLCQSPALRHPRAGRDPDYVCRLTRKRRLGDPDRLCPVAGPVRGDYGR